MIGVKNGKRIGMRLSTAAKDADEIKIRVQLNRNLS
jgi:hypothetical protein